MHARLLGFGKPFALTFGSQLGLKLGNHGEHTKEQASRRDMGVYLLVEDLEMHSSPGQLLRDLTQVQRRAGSMVEAGDNECVPLADEVEAGL